MTKAKQSESQRTVTTMRFDPKLLDRLDKQAKSEGRTRSNLIEHILSQALTKREKGKPSGVFG